MRIVKNQKKRNLQKKMSNEEDCKVCNLKMEEESFVCKVRFKEGALDNIEVLEGNEKKCRELFRNQKVGPRLKENIMEESENE